MNPRQLSTRLNKITDRQKIENFIRVAREFGYLSLVASGSRRLSERFPMSLPLQAGVPAQTRTFSSDQMMTISVDSSPRSLPQSLVEEEKTKTKGVRVIHVKKKG